MLGGTAAAASRQHAASVRPRMLCPMTAPLIWPQPGTPGDVLESALQRVLNEATAMTASGADLVPAYLRWAADAFTRLRRCLSADDVDRLVRPPTYWAAVAGSASSTAMQQVILAELAAQQDELRQILRSVEGFRQRFIGVPEAAMVLVPDTNVLLAHAETARDADWHGIVHQHVRHDDTVRLLIPLVVIDELDKLKDSTKEKTRTRARVMLKLIHSLVGDSPENRPTVQEATSVSGGVTLEVLMESPRHVRLPRNDDELVDVVARLRDMLGPRTVMTTFDTGADFRAAIRNVKHVRLDHAH